MASKQARELAASIAHKAKTHNGPSRERIRAGEVDEPQVMLAEFNSAFAVHEAPKPRLLFPNESGEYRLRFWADTFRDMAKQLKEDAAIFNEGGQQTTGLMLIRMQLSLEELAEMWDAALRCDWVGLLDALGDRSYVLEGDYRTFGMGALKLAALRAIHASNMSKLDEDGKPIIDASGRVVKSSSYTPPGEALRAILLDAGLDEIDVDGFPEEDGE